MSRYLQTNIRMAVIAVCALAFSSQARADVQTIRSSDNAFWGSVGTSFLNYQETITSPSIPDSEHGWIPSFAAGASVLTNSNLYLSLDGSYATGDAHYNGAQVNTLTLAETPYQGTTRESISTVDGKIGEGFAFGNIMMLTPYVDLGFRYWDRNLGQGQVEDYQNFDALAGLMLQVSPTNRLVLSAYGSAGTTFSASMKASIDGNTYNLGSAGVYKIGAKAGFDVTPRVELFTTLDYDHFRFAQSSLAADGYLEPGSGTEDTTARVGLAYHFR
jgi:hypothetical protein